MEKARKRFPDCPIYWLASYKADERTGRYPDIETLIKKAIPDYSRIWESLGL